MQLVLLVLLIVIWSSGLRKGLVHSVSLKDDINLIKKMVCN